MIIFALRVVFAELGVEIGIVIGYFGQCVIYLVKHVKIVWVHIFNGDLAFLAERHRPVTAKAAAWVYRNRDGVYRCVFACSHPKKIAYRHFNRWLGFAIPIDARNGQSPVIPWC